MFNDENEIFKFLRDKENLINDTDNKVVDEFKKKIINYNRNDFLLSISALSLIPNNQNASIILNTIISIALSIPIDEYDCRNKIGIKRFKEIIREFEKLTIKRNVDPPDYPFLESFIYYNNYELFMGTSNLAADEIQNLLDTIHENQDILSDNTVKKINTYIECLFNISSNISSRLDIRKIDYDNYDYNSNISIPSADELDFLKQISILKLKDYDRYKINKEAYDDLFLDNKKTIKSEYFNYDEQEYYYHPLIKIENEKFFPIDITIFPVILMNKVISTISEDDNYKMFLKYYVDNYKRCISHQFELMNYYRIDLKKYNLELKDCENYSETIFCHGSDSVFININFIDSGEKFLINSTTAMYKINIKKEKIITHLYEVVEKLLSFGTRREDIVIIITPISLGRTFSFLLPEVGTSVIVLKLYELKAIAINEPTQNLFLKRYVISKNKINIMPTLFSELNLIGLYSANDYSFYISNDIDTKQILFNYGGDYSAQYIQNSREKEKKHIVLSWNREYKSIVIQNEDGIYLVDDKFRDNKLKICVEKDNALIWIITDKIENSKQLLIDKNIMDYLSFWLMEYISSKELSLNIVLEIKNCGNVDDYYKVKIEKLENCIRLKENFNKIIVEIFPEIMTQLDCKTNRNEKELFKYFLLKLEEILNEKIYDEDVLNRIFENENKKRTITLKYDEFSYLKPFSDNKSRFINPSDLNVLLDEIGIMIKNKFLLKYGEINGDKCKEICNSVVDFLYEDIKKSISIYDIKHLLRALYYESERIVSDLMIGKESYINNIACFPSHKQDIDNNYNKITQSAIAIRFLIEYVSSLPSGGDKLINEYEMELLMAKSSSLIDWAYRSDLYCYKMISSPMSMLKSNRIGIDSEKFEWFNKPFYTMREQQMGSIGKLQMKELLNGFLKEKIDNSDFDEIFKKEFGFSVDNLMKFFWRMVDLNEKEIYEMNIKDLEKNMKDILDEGTFYKIIKKISLKKRTDFLKVEAGFSKEDVYPWRFNRELSLTRRPLIIQDDIVIWGNRNLSNAIFFTFQLIDEGRLKASTTKMKNYISKINNLRGKNFNRMIYNYLKKYDDFIIDMNVKEVNKNKIQDKNGNTLGDIDVLCIIPNKKKIILIETKNFNFVKNYYELYNEYREMFLDENGRKSFLTKHKNRAKWAKEHLNDFVVQYKLSSNNFKISYMFITSEYCIPNKTFNINENIYSAVEINKEIFERNKSKI